MRSRKHFKLLGALVAISLVISLMVGCGTQENVTDYSKAESWAYLPENAEEAVDVFFLTPTVFGGDDTHHNMELTDSKTKENFVGAINMEKGIYDKNTNFYAPYYQQISLNTYKLPVEEREPYQEIAYNDVKESFEYYMENYNDGHKLIIAGFSQGGQIGLKLLEDYFDDDKYQSKLVCAYLIGAAITKEDLKQYPHLKMAKGDKDTGVIVSFNSESKNVNSSIIVPDTTVGINPLNWKTDSTIASKKLNDGACFTDYSGKITSEVKGLCGAYLDSKRGTLKITGIKEKDYPPQLDIFDSGVYHIYDYMFFYRNLQSNVQTRIANF